MGETAGASARSAQACATPPRGACDRPAASARRARARRTLVSLACLAAALSFGDATRAATDGYKVEAAFLLNFAKLVQWPEAAAPAPDAPFVIGVAGPEALAQSIRTELEGASVRARPLLVRRVSGAHDVPGCHIVFVGSDRGEAEILAAARDHGALSVGEREGFATRGGVINFYSEGDKLRFEANPTAAERAGLELSSHLLRLAKPVEEP